MKVITQRDLIRAVADRWRQQYAPFSSDTPLFSTRNGITAAVSKKEISRQLDALDKETATGIDVANVIGNESWTRMTCDECREEVDWLVRVGQEPDYESQTAHLCKECVRKVADLLS